ncbi:MAG: hypothetical protein KF794_03720 [Xanthobacteraceae bacterium]|nr:hypothetical protein [Xanthobacteraceae bacterium]QYK45812.1 MAG: hypothetical protein KF794_03720 [Xanthobacteraceae bacterium]
MLEALGSFVVSFLAKLILGWIKAERKSQGDVETGRLRSELDHALEALRKKEAMAEIATTFATRADVLARLEEGSA